MKRTLNITLGISIATIMLSQSGIAHTAIAAPARHKAIKSNSIKQRAKPERFLVDNNEDVAHILNWIPDFNDACNVCKGYFKESFFVLQTPNPVPFRDSATRIRYTGEGTYSEHGVSIFRKNVVITQPGRIVNADIAYIFRDPKTGQFTSADLVGHVKLQEYGKLVAAQRGHVNFNNDYAEFKHTSFHLTSRKQPALTPEQKKLAQNYVNAWGHAKRAIRTTADVLEAWSSTYSTCNPLHPTWIMKAAKLTLDKKHNVGKAYNAVIKMHQVPVFWLPYYSFPINRERKSGFLAPSGGYTNQSGADISFPYYWNMAPNYDMLITPRYLSRRNLQVGDLFRFMTDDSKGHIYGSFLYNDAAFATFKTNTINQLSPPNAQQVPYVNQLAGFSNNRGYVSFADQSRFNERWNAAFDINYVSDPYYFLDVSNAYSEVSANQLMNQANVQYTGMHWNFTSLFQAYQTLHPINQISTNVENQYTRLPELDLDGDYPNLFAGAEFNVGIQAVEFLYQSDFYPISVQLPIGQRLHIRPGITRAFNWAAGFINPGIYLDNTNYNDEQATIPFNNTTPVVTSLTASRPSFEASRNLPIFNIDSGLYFERDFNFHQNDYIETLEPRLFYLYVPYLNQNSYPTFDTELLPFNYGQLYTLNRFTGFDRLENANQISLGLTSRILDGDNADQKLAAGVGIIYYIENPQVPLHPTDPLLSQNFSPITGELTFNPRPYWSLTSNAAWDPHPNQLDDASITAQYSRDWNHIALIGYEYAFANGQTLGFSNNTNLFKTGSSWGLTKKWSALGYWYYNISRQRPENYFAGLQYDTCCVAVRFIVNRAFNGVAPGSSAGNVTNEYTNTYFVQLQLKGLGGIRRNDPTSILGALPGFHDPLKTQPWG